MEIGNLFVNHLPSSMNFMPPFRFIGNPRSPYVTLSPVLRWQLIYLLSALQQR